MGPASLPTPLSPACGCSDLARSSGEPSIPASVSACFRARCLASRCPALRLADQRFVTGARAGIRLSLLPGPASTASTEVARMSAALHIRQAEAASLYLCRTAAAVGHSPFPLHFHRGQVLGLSDATFSHRSQRADLPLAGASCMPSLDRRGDRCRRHPWDKNHRNFRALRLLVPVAPRPEDRLKVRLNRRSDNI